MHAYCEHSYVICGFYYLWKVYLLREIYKSHLILIKAKRETLFCVSYVSLSIVRMNQHSSDNGRSILIVKKRNIVIAII